MLKYSLNCSDTTCSLWFYSKNEAIDFNIDIGDNVAFKSFMYKTKLVAETDAQPATNNNNWILENVTIAVSLKYLSNFLEITWNAIA